MRMPEDVAAVTAAFLRAAGEQVPGLVDGLYLHGSLGFGEYFPGASDVDFVAVLTERPGRAQLAGLASAHRDVRAAFPAPLFEGVHVVRADLSRPPDSCPDVPYVFQGSFEPSGRFSVNPVTWHELAWHGITVHGPDLGHGQVWTDAGALRSFTYANLSSYWAPVAAQLRAAPPEAITADNVSWCVLGISRLHHLLVTGSMTSKSGAGRHAMTVFGPRWRPIVTEALRARERPDLASDYGDDAVARGRDAAAFTTTALDSALAFAP
jgi:Domain of unknown function (DUF4111)